MNQYININPVIAKTVEGQRVRFIKGVTYIGGFDFDTYEVTGRPQAFLRVSVGGRLTRVVLDDTVLINNFRFLQFSKDEMLYAPVETVKRPRIKK
jgi:hypothetical protein